MKLKQVLRDIILEGNLSDFDGPNTPAALKKEKDLKERIFYLKQHFIPPK